VHDAVRHSGRREGRVKECIQKELHGTGFTKNVEFERRDEQSGSEAGVRAREKPRGEVAAGERGGKATPQQAEHSPRSAEDSYSEKRGLKNMKKACRRVEGRDV